MSKASISQCHWSTIYSLNNLQKVYVFDIFVLARSLAESLWEYVIFMALTILSAISR